MRPMIMRQLHPVSTHEKFVASGIYTRFENEKPNGVMEYWSIYALPDGAELIRVDHDGREYNGRSILVEAWRNQQEHIERFDLHQYGNKEDAIKSYKASFTFFDDYVQIGSTENDGARQQTEVELPKNCLIRPMTDLFSGLIISQLAKVDYSLPVYSVMPLLNDRNAPVGSIYEHKAVFVGEASIEVGGKTFAVRSYKWWHEALGCFSDEDPLVYLDQYDITLRFDIPSCPRILLTQYARRPEPKKL